MPTLSQDSVQHLAQFVEDNAKKYDCIVSVEPLNALILRELGTEKSIELHRRDLEAKIQPFVERAPAFVSALFNRITKSRWMMSQDSTENQSSYRASSQSARYMDEQHDDHSPSNDNHNDSRKRKQPPSQYDEHDGRQRKMRKYSHDDDTRRANSPNTRRQSPVRRDTSSYHSPERRHSHHRDTDRYQRRDYSPQRHRHDDDGGRFDDTRSKRGGRRSFNRDGSFDGDRFRNRNKRFSISPQSDRRAGYNSRHERRSQRHENDEEHSRQHEPHSPRNGDDGFRDINVFVPAPENRNKMYESYHPKHSEEMHRARVLADSSDQGSDRIALVLNSSSQPQHEDVPGRHTGRRTDQPRISSSSSHRPSPQHRQADFSTGGQATIRVQRVPEENNTEDQMRNYFSRFGRIVSVRCVTRKGIAFVDFESKQAALDAVQSPEAVFSNRFITLTILSNVRRGNETGASAPPRGAELHFQAPDSSAPQETTNGHHYRSAQLSFHAGTPQDKPFTATPSAEQLASTREGYQPPARLDLRKQQTLESLKEKHASLLQKSQDLIKSFKSMPKENVEQRGKLAAQLKKLREIMKRIQTQQEEIVNSLTSSTGDAGTVSNTAPQSVDTTLRTAAFSLVSSNANTTSSPIPPAVPQTTQQSASTQQTPIKTETAATQVTPSVALLPTSSASVVSPLTTSICVRNLSDNRDEDNIRRHFSQFGTISKVKFADNTVYVKFSNRHEAHEAMSKGAHFGTNTLHIEWSEELANDAEPSNAQDVEQEHSDMEDDDDLNFRR